MFQFGLETVNYLLSCESTLRRTRKRTVYLLTSRAWQSLFPSSPLLAHTFPRSLPQTAPALPLPHPDGCTLPPPATRCRKAVHGRPQQRSLHPSCHRTLIHLTAGRKKQFTLSQPSSTLLAGDSASKPVCSDKQRGKETHSFEAAVVC